MAEEIRLHVEQRTRENVERGRSPEEVRHATGRTFGRVEQVKETARTQRFFVSIDSLVRDGRYAARSARSEEGEQKI